ncbi:Flp pilus assembly complex ATPase component TadA, partial [Candidatus Bathyarchaeota archaeon]|nr:Flp pilus assembly complex ATPase component TadA [Candidatus Bathyarchaeota archaeon]
LLRSALRQRPDYIIVGEVRGEEAYTLFQSIATGHGGLCTIHSDTVDSVIKRLLTEPMNIPPLMFPLMNVVLQIRRVKVGDVVVRRATSVTEITGVTRDGTVETQERFTWNPEYDRYDYIEPHGDEEDCFSQISKTRHIRLEHLFKEHERRETIISWMVDRGINTYDEVAKVVRNYYVSPDEVYNAARLGLDG